MKRLIIGFDSAWTSHKKGALAGASVLANGAIEIVQLPVASSFPQAIVMINGLVKDHAPQQTVIFLDQPHIVANQSGARPVERIVSSLVSLRFGGMQTAATHTPDSKKMMFGKDAPVWDFLQAFGGPANPFSESQDSILVFETYPVLYLIANNWVLPDQRPRGRLPKYNPARRKTYSLKDWQFLCSKANHLAKEINAKELSDWFQEAGKISKPSKTIQDQLDAMLCLLQGLEWAFCDSFLVIGNMESGYVLTKESADLREELQHRCTELNKKDGGDNWWPDHWIKVVQRNRESLTLAGVHKETGKNEKH